MAHGEEAKRELVPDQAPTAPRTATPRATPPATTAPLGGERYRVCFTADGALHAQLQELRALMRHQVPDGDLASILGRAVALLLEQVRKRKFAEVSKPRPARPEAGAVSPCTKTATACPGTANETGSRRAATGAAARQVPAAIRRAVARQDSGRCSYVSARGLRCAAAAHNQYAACRDFGEAQMAQFRRRAHGEVHGVRVLRA